MLSQVTFLYLLSLTLSFNTVQARPQISLNDLLDVNSNMFRLERKDPNFGKLLLLSVIIFILNGKIGCHWRTTKPKRNSHLGSPRNFWW